MWCDDFDIDLPKVFPEALELLGDTADVKLFTHGHETGGKLNHPSVWNGQQTMIAFFGFYGPCKPDWYSTNEPIVECTFWEAMRDCWPHTYGLFVSPGIDQEHRLVFDSFELRDQFQTIMWHLRKWGKQDSQKLARAKENVLTVIKRSVFEMETLCQIARLS